jgi:hypothetical protein
MLIFKLELHVFKENITYKTVIYMKFMLCTLVSWQLFHEILYFSCRKLNNYYHPIKEVLESIYYFSYQFWVEN